VVVRGTDEFPSFSWTELIAMVPRTIGRELRKLGYFLPRAIGLLILSLIPGVNLIATPLWLIFGVWMMAVQYIDYPADNHKLGWNEMLAWLRSKRWACMGFGGVTYLALLIPVVSTGDHARRRRRRGAVLGARGRRPGAQPRWALIRQRKRRGPSGLSPFRGNLHK
jgi:Zn-dependent protease with chaperone function